MGGSAFSAGFDDCVREIGSDGTGFTSVHFSISHLCTTDSDSEVYRPASFSLSSQPKSLAVGDDASVFVAEIKNSIEVIRSNQKIFDLPTKYTPSAIAVKGSLVAIGGEVSLMNLICILGSVFCVTRVLLLPFPCHHDNTHHLPGLQGSPVSMGW